MQTPRTTALRARRILTGAHEPMINDGILLIRDDRIEHVGRTSAFGTIADEALDLGDVTVMAGLIDAHCHVTLPADGSDYDTAGADADELLMENATRNLRRHLQSGVTTARDNGARGTIVFAVREMLRRGERVGPRLLAAGRPITPRRGHFHFCGGEADSVDEIRVAVARLAEDGADHIKVMASGGGTPGTQPYDTSYGDDEIRAVIETANVLGLRTAAHCRSKRSVEQVVRAGVDCIEHVDLLEPPEACTPDGVVSASNRYDPRIASLIHESKAYLSLTMQAGGCDTWVALRPGRSSVALDEVGHARLAALEKYFAEKVEVFGRFLGDGFADRIAISTDAGPADTQFGRMHLGTDLAVEAGMTARQALASVTEIPAQLCGLTDRGSLKPGALADLLVVDGDPTCDIADLARVRSVFLGGRLVADAVADELIRGDE